MGYDLVAEAQRVLGCGPDPAGNPVLADPAPRLSRRRRLVPMAADVDGDAAAVLFARRGVSGRPCFELLLLEWEGGWGLSGGGGGFAEDDVLADRPPAAVLGGPLRWEGSGSCRSQLAPRFGLGRFGLGRRRWVHHAQVRAAAETHEVQVRSHRGERTLPVWRHGQLVVIWRGGDAPELIARDAHGRALGTAASLAAGGW